jgi:hypothetical protein
MNDQMLKNFKLFAKNHKQLENLQQEKSEDERLRKNNNLMINQQRTRDMSDQTGRI